jgi:hypothetical protein
VTFRRFAANVRRWFTGQNPEPPEDPYSSVRHPVRRGPPSRASAVAMEEPPEPKHLMLFGIRLPGR